jgi:uncharacterized protein (DUF2062 family)
MWKIFKWSTWHRWYIKIVKNEGTPHNLALGLALGVFAGFIIPTGFQIVFALALACFSRAARYSRLPALHNQSLDRPFFIAGECWVGSVILGYDLSIPNVTKQIGEILDAVDWTSLSSITAMFKALAGAIGLEVLLSFLLGGAVFAVVLSIPTYYLALVCVKLYRRRKELRLKLKESLLKGVHLKIKKEGDAAAPQEPPR